MANCNTKYNNDKPKTIMEQFKAVDTLKIIGWTLLAIVAIAGIVGLGIGIPKMLK
jgi:hypothetical protein